MNYDPVSVSWPKALKTFLFSMLIATYFLAPDIENLTSDKSTKNRIQQHLEAEAQAKREGLFRSAHEGYSKAQTLLGTMYEEGEGVPRDTKEAVHWYKKATNQGDAVGQYHLGLMYQHGNGVTEDGQEALRLFQLSANQGYDNAQTQLGVLNRDGDLVSKNETEAARWFQLAATQGNATAQFELGMAYSNGAGVPLDQVSAHMWLSISDRNGFRRAARPRDDLAESMTAEKIVEAQTASGVCQRSDYVRCR